MKQTMLIVGLGLIGGSLALALKGFEDFEIVGVDVSQPTLRYAAEHGYTSFTSTLFVSPYQNHELLRQTAEELGRQYGVPFLYRDFRPGFRDGQRQARELGFYMQKYCGCVFSEEDRYEKQILRDKKRLQAE